MARARESKIPKLPVRFTREHICHVTHKAIFGIKVEERWAKKKSLGQGGYGVVWLQQCVTDRAPGRLRAVKEILKLSPSSLSHQRELEAISKFSNKEYTRYFVRSSGWYENKHSIFIVMEYMKLGDLEGYLRDGPKLAEIDTRTITFQLLEALQFMHKEGYAHRDLKPANIFIKSKGPNWWVKVGDFGVSKRVDRGLTALRTTIGTPGYMAPEVFKTKHIPTSDLEELVYTSAVDIWSVGVTTFYMLTGRLPFASMPCLLQYAVSPDNTPFKILQNSDVTEASRDFVKQLLCVLPTDRPLVEHALQHNWRKELLPSDKKASGHINSSSDNMESIEASGSWSALGETDIESEVLSSDFFDPDVTQIPVPSSSPSSNESLEDKGESQTVLIHEHVTQTGPLNGPRSVISARSPTSQSNTADPLLVKPQSHSANNELTVSDREASGAEISSIKSETHQREKKNSTAEEERASTSEERNRPHASRTFLRYMTESENSRPVLKMESTSFEESPGEKKSSAAQEERPSASDEGRRSHSGRMSVSERIRALEAAKKKRS